MRKAPMFAILASLSAAMPVAASAAGAPAPPPREDDAGVRGGYFGYPNFYQPYQYDFSIYPYRQHSRSYDRDHPRRARYNHRD